MAKRLYSLFEKRGFRYHRVSQLAYPKSQATRVFQGALLAPVLSASGPGGTAFSRCLRPVFDSWDGDGITRIYRPAVESNWEPRSGYEQLANRLTGAVVKRLRASVRTVPQARTYRSGGAK